MTSIAIDVTGRKGDFHLILHKFDCNRHSIQTMFSVKSRPAFRNVFGCRAATRAVRLQSTRCVYYINRMATATHPHTRLYRFVFDLRCASQFLILSAVQCTTMTQRYVVARCNIIYANDVIPMKVLEREKRRTLSGEHRKTPHIEGAPGWNEHLASSSEAFVKVL
jgi:hypothetical protein